MRNHRLLSRPQPNLFAHWKWVTDFKFSL